MYGMFWEGLKRSNTPQVGRIMTIRERKYIITGYSLYNGNVEVIAYNEGEQYRFKLDDLIKHLAKRPYAIVKMYDRIVNLI